MYTIKLGRVVIMNMHTHVRVFLFFTRLMTVVSFFICIDLNIYLFFRRFNQATIYCLLAKFPTLTLFVVAVASLAIAHEYWHCSYLTSSLHVLTLWCCSANRQNVLIRLDLNVPLDKADGKTITNDKRLRAVREILLFLAHLNAVYEPYRYSLKGPAEPDCIISSYPWPSRAERLVCLAMNSAKPVLRYVLYFYLYLAANFFPSLLPLHVRFNVKRWCLPSSSFRSRAPRR